MNCIHVFQLKLLISGLQIAILSNDNYKQFCRYGKKEANNLQLAFDTRL